MSSNSLGFENRPGARTLYWYWTPAACGGAPIWPAGIRMFCSRIAPSTSETVSARCASRSGSSQTRIE